VFPSFALLSARLSCHHSCRAGAADVDEGVPDLALAMDQIQPVMTGAELGRGFGSGLYHHRGGPSAVS
jgi:hypothetical protein